MDSYTMYETKTHIKAAKKSLEKSIKIAQLARGKSNKLDILSNALARLDGVLESLEEAED